MGFWVGLLDVLDPVVGVYALSFLIFKNLICRTGDIYSPLSIDNGDSTNFGRVGDFRFKVHSSPLRLLIFTSLTGSATYCRCCCRRIYLSESRSQYVIVGGSDGRISIYSGRMRLDSRKAPTYFRCDCGPRRCQCFHRFVARRIYMRNSWKEATLEYSSYWC
jgi:hypothetical protein